MFDVSAITMYYIFKAMLPFAILRSMNTGGSCCHGVAVACPDLGHIVIKCRLDEVHIFTLIADTTHCFWRSEIVCHLAAASTCNGHILHGCLAVALTVDQKPLQQ